MIELKNVNKVFNIDGHEVEAVKNVNLKITHWMLKSSKI